MYENEAHMPLAVVDTRPLFRPLCADIVTLFRALTDDDWGCPTVAGTWRVRDVAAHLTDTALRRLSFHRDGLVPDGRPPTTQNELVALINELNASWVRSAARLSPRVLTDLYAAASTPLADFIESLDLHSVARFAVSWAGQTQSPQWLDVGREFTEIWHHGSQIRDAVHAGPFREARWLRAVLEIAMHALPAAYGREPGISGGVLVLNVTGPSGGTWTVHNIDGGWSCEEGFRELGRASATTTVTLSDQTAWRLLFNALHSSELGARVDVEGDQALALPLFRTRALVI
jgi:uncharacterized protein (TIGR03083 family)